MRPKHIMGNVDDVQGAGGASVDWARLTDLGDAVGQDVLVEIVQVGMFEVPAMLANLLNAEDGDLTTRAHALKSVLGNLGMTASFECCERIEVAARADDARAARAQLHALDDAIREALEALRIAFLHPGGAG